MNANVREKIDFLLDAVLMRNDNKGSICHSALSLVIPHLLWDDKFNVEEEKQAADKIKKP